MAPTRLDLSALRASLARPGSNGEDSYFFADLLTDRPVSRRTALQASGAAMAGMVPAIGKLHTLLGVEVVDHGGRLSFRLGGVERWAVDPRRYAGRPRLRHRRLVDGSLRVELRGARYPGTRLPASFTAEIRPGLLGSRMRIEHALGGLRLEVPFESWLRGEARARGRLRMPDTTIALDRRMRLRLGGGAEAELTSDGALSLRGRGLATLAGPGLRARSDTVTLTALGAAVPSLFEETPHRRALIQLERERRKWRIEPRLRIAGPGALRFTEQPFERIEVEAGETGRRVARGLVARSASGEVGAFWEPGGRLIDEAGNPASVPLTDLRFAVGGGATGERALLAAYGEATWLHGAGFSLHVGGPQSATPFEVAQRRGAVEVRCEPDLLHASFPLADALVEPATYEPGQRIDLTGRSEGDSNAVARLRFGGEGHHAELSVEKIPPLLVFRSEDLFWLVFRFINLGLEFEGGGAARLVREKTDDAPGSFVVAHFPFQNVTERAFYERAQDYSQQKESGEPLQPGDPGYEPNPNASDNPTAGDIPVANMAAGRTQLAFRVPAELSSLPFTLNDLLAWERLEPSLVAPALPPPPPLVIARGVLTRPRPGDLTTRVALPTGVISRIRGEPQVDEQEQQRATARLKRNLGRNVRIPDAQIEAIAATLAQTRPGLKPLPADRIDEIIAKLLRRPTDAQLWQTGIESPWRLILSPNRFSAWAHATRAVTRQISSSNQITELWHTRLAVLRPADEEDPEAQPGVDEQEDYYRTLRAVWSPDYVEDYDANDPPHFNPNNPNNHPSNLFRMSLDARDRHELVVLTSDFTVPGATGRYVRAERFMLTALGAWMNVRGGWTVPIADEDDKQLSVEEWRHRATMGRDHYVKVVYKGFLFPFGHPASLVKVTERKFHPSRYGQTAFLRQRMYVVVREPEKAYPAFMQREDQARKLPFRRVVLNTLETPPLDPPQDIPGAGVSSPQEAFWLRVDGDDFLFHCVAEDIEGQRIEFTMPLAFIDVKFGVETATAQAVAESMASRGSRAMNGQNIAYAPSQKAGDTTFETSSLTFGAESATRANKTPLTAGDKHALRLANQPAFYPAVASTSVEIPAVKRLTGAAGSVAATYHDNYVNVGFEGAAGDANGNAGQVFLRLADATGLGFGGGSAGTDKVGALANPDLSISGLSRAAGPVSGDVDEMVKGSFDPAKFFGDLDAKILGGLSLIDIIKAITGFSGQVTAVKDELESALEDIAGRVTSEMLEALPRSPVPAFATQLIYENGGGVTDIENAGRLPKQVQIVFKWDPEVQESGPFKVDGDPADTLSLTSLGLVPLDSAGNAGEPSYTVAAYLKKFTLDLFGIIAIKVGRVDFRKQAAEKPDVKADIEDVLFQGPLAFVNELQEMIPSDGFVNPSIDVLPTGIQAGISIALPTIGTGVFTLENISLGARLTVPFTGDPLRFRFNFCTREQPFVLTVYGLGGGGFFAIEHGLDGVELVEAALEFGASIAVDFGVASGGVSVKAGIYFSMEVDLVTLTGFFRLQGYLDVLGLISASILFYLALTYQNKPKMVWGEAKLVIKVEVLFFSAKVELKCRKEFATPLPPGFAQLMNEDDWIAYRHAFAS